MVIVMSAGVESEDLARVVSAAEREGLEVNVSRGSERTIVGLVGDVAGVEEEYFAEMPSVESVVRISVPFKLVSAEHHEKSTVFVGEARVAVGPEHFTFIAGPCAVESFEQTLAAARMAQGAGAVLLRGGAYKPRTSPYAFQGLGVEGLEILGAVREETGMPVVTEIVDAHDMEDVVEWADMLQVGTRNMQNFALLSAVGESGKPVMLKRGMSSTIEEWLMAAEYIARRGNLEIVLCERGIRTFETATRNTLDVSAVAVAHGLSHLPVVVDPSHSGGRRDLVLPLSRAAMGVGADGIIVDVHPDPTTALCDGAQALLGEELAELGKSVRAFPSLLGKQLATL